LKHIVAKGESIYQISKKYHLKQDDIFKLNPSAKNKLKLNSVLLIPIPKSEIQNITHEVLPKQTLYGISKQYNVSIEDIKKANPIIDKEGLEIGLKLTIPQKGFKPEVAISSKSSSVNPVVELEEISHIVLPKETKYGLSKKYKISIEELEKLNPESVKDLAIGMKIIIRKGKNSNLAVLEENNTAKPNDIILEVKPKESISENKPKDSVYKAQPEIITLETKPKDSISETKPNLENLALADKLVVTASENIGTHYRSGGTQKGGFDCSGLMIYTFSSFDIKLPRTSNEMSRFGNSVEKENAQKGDLIFFSTNGTGNVNHVGMITEIVDDEIKFIHSSVHGGVIISSVKEAYYAKRFIKINRVLE
jgi:peptidoglycan DL-endopeptidase LytE